MLPKSIILIRESWLANLRSLNIVNLNLRLTSRPSTVPSSSKVNNQLRLDLTPTPSASRTTSHQNSPNNQIKSIMTNTTITKLMCNKTLSPITTYSKSMSKTTTHSFSPISPLLHSLLRKRRTLSGQLCFNRRLPR